MFALTLPNVNMISISIYKNKIKKKEFLSASLPNMNIISIYKDRFNVQIMKINKIKKKQFLFALTFPNMNMISISIYKET